MPGRLPASALALALIGCAGEPSDAPGNPSLQLTGRVVDEAAVLEPTFEVEMTEKLARLEDATGVQLVVVTTSGLKSQAVELYSVDLARAWGIGSDERLDGLMVLVAPQERQVRIEVGYGLEASVKDGEAAHIIRQDMIPHFRNGDFESGVEAGVDRLIEEVTPVEVKQAS